MYDQWFIWLDLASHLKDSLWTLELECALEGFSLSAYVNWIDHHQIQFRPFTMDLHSLLPEDFLNYLKGNVSNPAVKSNLMFSSLC